MKTKIENFTLPNGCVLTKEAMDVLHQLQFNQGYINHSGLKNQDIEMYKELISNVQDFIAESAHQLKNDDHILWRKYLLHIAEMADIKRIIKLLSHPD